MAINKITNEQRELMRQKSAQSLPDVPSSKGWTPKNFKDAMTKPLFDNENSFFAFYNALVEQIENIKFDKEDYDFKNLGTFENEKGFAQTCESFYYNSQREGKNFAYKGYITSNGNQSTALCLVGYTSGSGMNFDSMVISHKGITCYKQGNEVAIQMPKVEVTDLKVNVSTSVPYPSSNESAINKYYLDSNHYKKDAVDSSINTAMLNGIDESKKYTDIKYNEVNSVLDGILKDAPTPYDTLKEIADYIASDKTGASEMLAKINNNTSEINVIKQGLPETLDIVLRSVVSADTTYEIKEIESNKVKYKIGVGGDSVRQPLNWNDIKDDVVIQARDDYSVEINLEEINIEDVKLVIDLNNDYVNGKPIWEYARGLLTNINTQEAYNLTFKFDDMKNSELRVLAHYDFGDVYALDYNTSIGFENNYKQYYCPDNIGSASVHKGEYYHLQMNFEDNSKYILTDEEDYINIKYIHDMEV